MPSCGIRSSSEKLSNTEPHGAYLCVMWSLFLSYCQTNKITNMSNNSENSIKYQQDNFSFANGTGQAKNLQICYDAGYLQRQQEDLEKHRWIPVEEDNPPIDESLRKSDLHYSITVEVMNDIKIQSAYFNTETGQWRSLITGNIINPTHWRSFL